LNIKESGGAYVYQGTTLVVPVDTPDSRLQEEIKTELIERAFAGSAVDKLPGCMDSFTVPSADGKDGTRFFNVPEGKLPEGWKAVPMRQALNIITGGTMAGGSGPIGRILRSHHISQWRKDSRFCGSCGAANRDADSGELARQCPACGRLEFPRISPAVITIVINDRGEALLAHNIKFVNRVYSLIAGFNEAGESLEDTVAREIKEEVNLDVNDVRYIHSQPWPFPNSLMLGFSARHSGGEIRADGIEIEDARWFSRDNLPELPGSGSISRYIIGLWLEGKL
jgi:NAD+ diphosphatase